MKEHIDTLKAWGVREDKAERAVSRGWTPDDLVWNQRFNRPPHFVETVHPQEELRRRQAWSRAEANRELRNAAEQPGRS